MARNANKVKGSSLERLVAQDLRAKFPFVKTSRQANRMMDDCGIDLVGIPLKIQCKAGYNAHRPKFEQLFLSTEELIKQKFSPNHPVHKVPYVLIHKLNRTLGGSKQQPENFQVVLQYDFFLELIEHWKTDLTEI